MGETKIKKIYILDFGEISADFGWFIPNPSTLSEKDISKPRNWITVPVTGVLIEHKDGNILFDTGPNPNATSIWPKQVFELFPITRFSNENKLENQLKQVGFKTEDIDFLIFSHLHLDHVGQAYLFINSNKTHIISHKKELQYALWLIWMGKIGAYLPSDLEPLKGKNWFTFDGESLELLEGINLYLVGGHTPGSIIMTVNTGDKNFILAGDFLHLPEELELEQKGWLLGNAEEYFNNIKKLKLILKKHNTKIIICHDPKIWDKYPKSPKSLI